MGKGMRFLLAATTTWPDALLDGMAQPAGLQPGRHFCDPTVCYLPPVNLPVDLCTHGKHTCMCHAATHTPLEPCRHQSTHLPVPLGLAHTLETGGAALAVPRRVLEHSSSHDTQDTVLNAQMVTCAPWRHPPGSTVHGDRGGTPPVSRATPQRLQAGCSIALSGTLPACPAYLAHCAPADTSPSHLPSPCPAHLAVAAGAVGALAAAGRKLFQLAHATGLSLPGGAARQQLGGAGLLTLPVPGHTTQMMQQQQYRSGILRISMVKRQGQAKCRCALV
jgi:hypothetical protein